MTSIIAHIGEFQDALDTLARIHGVPGAQLAVAKDDKLVDFATGVVNVNTGVATTTDAVFQIGSNTKLFTATLIMQLVGEGKVDLDEPVSSYLPKFRLSDPDAGAGITVRHLLTHQSGIQGDCFEGFGRGEDSVERYVEFLSSVDLVHPTGQFWSYCNSAFVVAGRIVEVITGQSYGAALAERICAPLGLVRTTVFPEEMIAERCAVGHTPGRGGRPTVPPMVVMEAAQVPAGTRTTSTATELTHFVQMHLNGGRDPEGKQLLAPELVQAMCEPQIAMPRTSTAAQFQGIGWLMGDWGDKRVIGHTGGTIGQTSFTWTIPNDRLTVTLLTNSATGILLWRDLGDHIFNTLAGVPIARPLTPPETVPVLSLDRYCGTYERYGFRHTVKAEGGSLHLYTELSGAMAALHHGPPPPPLVLRVIDEERFAVKESGIDGVVAFAGFQRGKPQYLFDGRLARRTKTTRQRATKDL